MYKETRIFYPNKLKTLALLSISTIFVVGGFSLIDKEPIIGWLTISFFSLGIIVSIVQFIPNSTYLKLNHEGFEVKGLFKSNFTKWIHVKDLREGSINGNKMIFFDYTEQHRKWKKGKKLSKFLSGKEGAVQSSYNIKTKVLLQLMIDYKKDSESQFIDS
ncbi:MAG: hypothetical protein MK202_02440 [Tenacibaculum sp.]|nr:hypothetical protein [Tenacibaculum sp.]